MKSLPHTVHLVLDRELRILVGSPLTLYILDAGQGGDSDLQPVWRIARSGRRGGKCQCVARIWNRPPGSFSPSTTHSPGGVRFKLDEWGTPAIIKNDEISPHVDWGLGSGMSDRRAMSAIIIILIRSSSLFGLYSFLASVLDHCSLPVKSIVLYQSEDKLDNFSWSSWYLCSCDISTRDINSSFVGFC